MVCGTRMRKAGRKPCLWIGWIANLIPRCLWTVITYEAEYDKASDEFYKKYGYFGFKLQTEEELEANKKRGGGGTVHFMDELPEYKEIHDLHRAEERKLEEYREQCKNEALDMLKEYFFSLWD